jgi:hypothetical protein
MKLRWLVEEVARRSSALTLLAVIMACGTASPGGTTPASAVPPSANDDPGAAADSGAVLGSDASVGPEVPSGSDAESGVDSGSGSSQASSEAGDDASGPEASGPDTAPACVKGQVTPNEVVMLGDSYLDPNWGNVGPTIMMDANAMYRHYYIGAASMAWGNPDTQFYIPYQYDPMAKTDTSVMNPADIKVIIMDGGGNDVLIGNTSCEQTAPPGNTSCVTTVRNAIDKAQSEMQQMAADGVKSIVYFFYPHLDPAGGGILSTPAPAINDTLDYAYPLAEQICCGSSFTSTIADPTCSGEPVPGTTCVFVDTRPSFEGHLADYIKSDHVHPTQAGAQVISDLVWKAMQDHCIAQ